MRENQETIINALAITIIATLFFFALTFILFNFFKIETSLKDAWATLGSFFGGITTLVAAYVASRLFNDWRDQEKFNSEKTYFDLILPHVHQLVLDLYTLLRLNQEMHMLIQHGNSPSEMIENKTNDIIGLINANSKNTYALAIKVNNDFFLKKENMHQDLQEVLDFLDDQVILWNKIKKTGSLDQDILFQIEKVIRKQEKGLYLKLLKNNKNYIGLRPEFEE
ncbi:hypothetical protein ACWKWF_08320 [Acinetobacter kookii]